MAKGELETPARRVGAAARLTLLALVMYLQTLITEAALGAPDR